MNRGLSAYNTRWALQTLPYVFDGPSAGPTARSGSASAGAAASTAHAGEKEAVPEEGEAGTRGRQAQHQQHQSHPHPEPAASRVLFATILFGANDAVLPDAPA